MIVQEAAPGVSRLLDATQSLSFVNSSLQASITPQRGDTFIEIDVRIPLADVWRVSGSPMNRGFHVRVVEKISGATVIDAHVYGQQSVGPSTAMERFWTPVYIVGRYPVQTAGQSLIFGVQIRSGEAGTEARLRGNESRQIMYLKEIVAGYPIPKRLSAPVLDRSKRPDSAMLDPANPGNQVIPTIHFDGATGEFSLYRVMQQYQNNQPMRAIGLSKSTDPTNFPAGQTLLTVEAWPGPVAKFSGGYIATLHRFNNPGLSFARAASDTDPWIADASPTIPSLGPHNEPAEIQEIWWNPIRNKWNVFAKANLPEPPPGGSATGSIRTTKHWEIDDLTTFTGPSGWTEIGRPFAPDAHDPAGWESYGASPPLYIDGVLISFLRVLRDDIGDGIGYTVIATSRDGLTWHRQRQPLLDRGEAGSFDASVAWVYSATVAGDRVYMVYSAYDTGHKVGNRTIGIAWVDLDAMRAVAASAP